VTNKRIVVTNTSPAFKNQTQVGGAAQQEFTPTSLCAQGMATQ
jgi:hypothetical protein